MQRPRCEIARGCYSRLGSVGTDNDPERSIVHFDLQPCRSDRLTIGNNHTTTVLQANDRKCHDCPHANREEQRGAQPEKVFGVNLVFHAKSIKTMLCGIVNALEKSCDLTKRVHTSSIARESAP